MKLNYKPLAEGSDARLDLATHITFHTATSQIVTNHRQYDDLGHVTTITYQEFPVIIPEPIDEYTYKYNSAGLL